MNVHKLIKSLDGSIILQRENWFQGILPNGQEIAVKRIVRGLGQGDVEFKNEVSDKTPTYKFG